MTSELDAFDAVVLAGGRARRLRGLDKAAVEVGGATLLERVLGAVGHARLVVVVGPVRHTGVEVVTVREEPEGGGPVAAIAAALPHLRSGLVTILAADLPFVTASEVDLLRHELAVASPATDGVVAEDDAGRRQWLLGVWRVAALARAVDGLGRTEGVAMRDLTGRLRVSACPLPSRPDTPPPWLDVDTPDDLRTARRSV